MRAKALRAALLVVVAGAGLVAAGVLPAAASSAATVTAAPNFNWDQFRHTPTHTGFNRYENVLSPSNVARLTLDWSFRTGNTVRSSPSVVNGVVYIGAGHNVYAFHLPGGIAVANRPNPRGLHPNDALRLQNREF